MMILPFFFYDIEIIQSSRTDFVPIFIPLAVRGHQIKRFLF